MARVMSLVVEFLRTQTAFWAMWMIVGAVSCYDAYLIQRYQFSIQVLEENPIGRWLLEVGQGEVLLFVRAKLAGTLVVLTVLAWLYRHWRRIAHPTAIALATFQLGLLVYLTTDITRVPEQIMEWRHPEVYRQRVFLRDGRFVVETKSRWGWRETASTSTAPRSH